MKILVTAGGTFSPIDEVRGISNIFNGKTGVLIADCMSHNDEEVTLLIQKQSRWLDFVYNQSIIKNVIKFSTYDDLYHLMEDELVTYKYDVVIHSAAVSDYKVEGVFIQNSLEPNRFMEMEPNRFIELPSNGKLKSSHDELFLKLIPTEKIVDKIKTEWNFKGTLVKFKLEVGLTDEELLKIAKKSRLQSGADIMVANCLEWAKKRAYVITEKSVTNIQRDLLSNYLYGEICKIV